MSSAKILEIPMWDKQRKLMLSDILSGVVAPETLNWRLQELAAVGGYPVGAGMEDFENRVKSEPMGYPIDFSALCALAKGLTDLTSISLSGQMNNVEEISILAEDSTRWTITFVGGRFRLDYVISGEPSLH